MGRLTIEYLRVTVGLMRSHLSSCQCAAAAPTTLRRPVFVGVANMIEVDR
jgi:hypothetical protein